MIRYSYFAHLQKAFVEIVAERAQALGFSGDGFAVKVWPEQKKRTACNRWRVMRLMSPVTGKPQGVLIEDAFRMAETLGENPLYLLGKAAERALIKTQTEEHSPK